ncbi:MAG: glutamate 5-kinase [Dehalococcoidales bacterium]|nr:glutamate 5-kinase [Dehalococcoidales bacterium]
MQQNKKRPVFKRIVVKLGTHLVTGDETHLNMKDIAGLVDQIARLHGLGAQIVLVSSGAITSGRQKLQLVGKMRGMPYKQVLAAVGQSRLMNTYEYLFDRFGITVAQALQTKTDISGRAGYLNARNTLLALMELGVICIVNENDIVSTDEIKEAKFGDNDNLSALVANLVDADILMMLTDIDGLYNADPTQTPDAELIPLVTRIDASIRRMAKATRNNVGTGGMITKIEAAQVATSSGVLVVIANGREPDVILRLADGEAIGTRFPPTTDNMESRERWMVSGLCTRGKIIVDSGAAEALNKNKKSLLAAGIKTAEGRFGRGDIVAIYDPEGNQLGCGITNYSSGDIGIIKGSRSDKIATLLSFDYGPEVVHRNNLVLMQRGDPRGHRQTVPIP